MYRVNESRDKSNYRRCNDGNVPPASIDETRPAPRADSAIPDCLPADPRGIEATIQSIDRKYGLEDRGWAEGRAESRKALNL